MDKKQERTVENKAESPRKQEKPSIPDEEKTVLREKLHKRHMRALKDILIRFLLLCLVVYILFFHLVGITVMPSGDMYPRIDAGDLVLYYRLEKNIHAQDVVVFEKPTASLDASYQEHKETADVAKTGKAWWRKALDWLGFRDPADPPMTLFVCRVVAVPGDTVEIGTGDHPASHAGCTYYIIIYLSHNHLFSIFIFLSIRSQYQL